MREDRNLVLSKKLRIVIYNRVSTNAQEEEGTSLETQREDNTAYCLEHGYEIIDVVDETHTGYELEQRKKLKGVLKRCVNREVDGIVFRTYDRLSRNTVHRTVIEYDAERYGYELMCSKEQYDGDSFEHKLMRQLMSAFAELERMKIKERTAEGKKKRAQSGRLLNGRKARYGYAYVDDDHANYKIVEKEVEIIHRIDSMYLEGLSQRRIAEILTKEGVPTPMGNRKVWSKATVAVILGCSEYHGEGYAYNTTEVVIAGKKSRRRSPEKRIQMPEHVYPIVRSIEIYNAIQERIKNAHSTSITSHIPEEILLRGHIRCECGYAMVPGLKSSTYKGKAYKYVMYRCYGEVPDSSTPIHSVQINSSIIEPAVINYVSSLLKDLSVIEKALTTYIESHTSETSVQSYDNALEQLKEQQRLLSLDLKSTKGNVRQLVLNQMNALEEDIEKVEKTKREVVGDGDRWEVIKKDIVDVITWIQAGNTDMESASFEEKRRLLRALGIVAVIGKAESTAGKASKRHYEIHVPLPIFDTLDSTTPTIFQPRLQQRSWRQRALSQRILR